MWPAEQRAAQFPSGLYRVQQTKLMRRNVERIEWSLVANCDIPLGTFLGFYTGDHEETYRESLYAADLANIYIYPFKNESNITEEERKSKPFANMNEPNAGDYANCCFVNQDFDHREVEGVENIPNYDIARFFRGLACFTCDDVKRGQELTWHYGKLYQANREEQQYEAGKPCVLLLHHEEFIPGNSQGVLSIMSKVPHTCLVAVTGLKKSNRFPLPRKKRRKKRDSSDDEDDSSSLESEDEPKYKPSETETRADRLKRRQERT